MNWLNQLRRLITGSRHWPTSCWWMVWEECHGADSLVLGDCPTGADLWARRFAQFYQVEHRVHLADWHRHRARAGPLRNTEMVKDSPDEGVAFLVGWDPCKGTRDCWGKCERAGVPVKPVRPPQAPK